MPLKPVMNAEKLKRLQTQVRIGGKGTPRRKKKVIHQTAAADDKKLQSSLKKLSVSTIPGIEEVNIIKDDLTVIHFNNPKAQASLSANTFAVTGHGEVKKVVEMLPEILPQLGQENVSQLRMLANSMTTNQKEMNGGRFGPNMLGSIDEDDVPALVNDFDEVAKKEDLTKGKSSKEEPQQSKYFAPSNVQSQQKKMDSDHNDSDDNVVTISLPRSKIKNEKIASTGETNQIIGKNTEGVESVSSPSKLALVEKKTGNKIKNDKSVQNQKDKKLKASPKTSDDLDNEFNEGLNMKGDVSFAATIILENLPLNEVNPVNVDNYAYRQNTETTSSKNQNIVEIGVSHQGNGVQQISLNVGSKEFIREQNKQIKNDSEESKAIALQRPGENSDFNEDLNLQSPSQSLEDPDSICVIGVEGHSSSPITITVSISHNKENNNDDDERQSEQLNAIDKTCLMDAAVESQQMQTEAIALSPGKQENRIDNKKEFSAPKITGPPVVCVDRKQAGSNQGKDKEQKPKDKILEVQQSAKNKSPRLEDKKESLEVGKATNTKQIITPVKKQTPSVEGTSPADTNKVLTEQKKNKSEASEKISNDQPNTQPPATPPKTAQKSNAPKGQTTKDSGKQQTKVSALSSTATKSSISPKKSDTTPKPKVTPTKSPSPSATGNTVQKLQSSPKTSTNATKTEKVTASPKNKVPSSPSAKQQATVPLKSPSSSSAKKGQAVATPSTNASNSSPTQSKTAEVVAQAKLKPDGNIIKDKKTGEPKS